jgi:hypothetical protein
MAEREEKRKEEEKKEENSDFRPLYLCASTCF